MLSNLKHACLFAFICLSMTINLTEVEGQQNGFATRSVSQRYVPRHLRNEGSQNPVRVAQGSAIPSNTVSEAYPNGTPIITEPAPSGGNYFVEGSHIGGYLEGEYVDEGYGGHGHGCGCDDCGSGAYFDRCGFGPANDCRDCEPIEDCWMNGLGGLLYNGEYFAGAHAFTSPGVFQIPGTNQNGLSNSSFGFHGGFNFGLPLYRLTCGLVSGQFGANVVTSNYNGSPLSSDNRGQLFVTAGLFRRVDQGLQFGVVADVLHEEWFAELDIVQIRGDLSYAMGNNRQIGFRFAEGVQDSSAQGIFENVGLTNVTGDVFDTYRFYYHHACECGGYNEFYIGWSGESHTVVGFDYDLPLNYKWALRSGFTYLIPEDDDPNQQFGNSNEAWNVSVGLVWRPRGRNWYPWYHRPILPVADNGSMIIRRNNN